jgi:excisionase family DNA binding protein
VVDQADGNAQPAREVLAVRQAYRGMDTDQPLTLTVEQTAKLLGIGRSTAYELVRTGDIPSLRLGRRIVVPAARLAALLELTHTKLTKDGRGACDGTTLGAACHR